jgi:Flp pilus assembly protein TadB
MKPNSETVLSVEAKGKRMLVTHDKKMNDANPFNWNMGRILSVMAAVFVVVMVMVVVVVVVVVVVIVTVVMAVMVVVVAFVFVWLWWWMMQTNIQV